MSETKRLTNRNEQIAAMLADGEQLKNFYRFIAQNPHINLHDACQIIIERPNATVCFSFNEWVAMDRRITKGRKGIAYYDNDGYKQFVFDANDTHGDNRYSRPILPMKRLLGGLDELNDAEFADSEQSDFVRIQNGVLQYLHEQGELTYDGDRDKLLIDGISYSLYSKTGFPKSAGIKLSGLPFSYKENAEFVKDVYYKTEMLVQSIEEAYSERQEEVEVIDDTEEETVSDEPVIPDEQSEIKAEEHSTEAEPKHPMYTLYKRYMEVQSEKPQAIVMMRLGDFYEMLGDSAIIASKTLNLTLTGRDVGLPERVAMCGIPYHAMDVYVDKILKSRGVVLIENDKEPIYILSHAEALEQNAEAIEEKAEPMITETTDFESTPLNDEQSETDEDWRKELAAELSDLDEEQSDEEIEETGSDEEEELDDTDSDEQDEYEETESDEEPKDKDNKESTPKKPEKGIKDRKREKSQPTLFDLIEQKEKSAEEALIERQLKYGSGIQDGKFRIFDKYQENPTPKTFADFLKNEYGWGGHGGWNDDEEMHDGKGITMAVLGEKGERLVQVSLKWPEVAVRIADLIDDDNYLTEQEKKKYVEYKVEQNRLRELRAEEERRKNEFIDHVIYSANPERKQRILDEYANTKQLAAFSEFLKNEYGTCEERGDGFYAIYNAQGIWLYKGEKSDDYTKRICLNWDEFADKVCKQIENDRYIEQVEPQAEQPRDSGAEKDNGWNKLIENGILKPVESESFFNRFKQLTAEDRAFFDRYRQRYMREPTNSTWGEVQHCRTIANGVYEVSTAGHGGVMIDVEIAPHILSPEAVQKGYRDGIYYCYEEDCAACIPLRELWDKGILSEAHEYFTHYYVNSNRPEAVNGCVPFNKATEAEKAEYFKWWNNAIDESLENWNDKYWQVYKHAELAETEWAIKRFVDLMIEERTREIYGGNHIYTFDHFTNEAEQFAREHIEDIVAELEGREEVSDVELTDEGIDVNFYLDYCPNYEDIWHEFDDKEDNKNTDLNDVLDQSELGGAKTRFRNNIAAIRLVNKLYAENRTPTDEEKKVLSQYVGWGGLSQAFDENNTQWKKEYAELKGLLSQEDYEQARGSTLNAYYTPKDVINGIYAALNRFGVKGNNRILEPSMGTGNFFGFMPKEIAEGSRLYGVELDNLTGRIAAKLYPQANVQIKGFEDTNFPDNKFDIVVGNVPFGGYGVADSAYNRYNFKVHDYFLAKSIDKVKSNGIVAIVTSKGTMDKLNPSARKYVAERAELLGAIRLPNTAFKQTAGTEAVADILFFRKREEKITDLSDVEWLGTDKTAEGYEINNYFVRHPEMILGTLAEDMGLYGGKDVTIKPDGRNLSEAIAEAIERLPQGFYTNPETAYEEESAIKVDYNVKPMCYKADSGRLYMRVGDEMQEQAIPKFPNDAYQRIKSMIALREELHHILDIQIQGCSDEVLQEEQKRLNSQYDLFVKQYGELNSQTNTRLFKEDGDAALLLACEDVDKETGRISKAEIFFKRTIRPYVVPTSTDDPFEALQISKNERGRVDIEYIEELTGKSYDDVLFELGDAVFRNPEKADRMDKYSGFETSEEYLSGRVVEKLNTAKRYAEKYPEFKDNVSALEKVQPKPLTASEISVRLGATWIDKEIYKQFYMELVGVSWWRRSDLELFYNPFDSSWRLDQKESVRIDTQMKQREVYGTNRAPAYRLFMDCMNLKATTIYDTVLDEDGKEKRVLNHAETIAAREKQNKIKEEFANWIFAKPERREELEATYNRLFNQIKLPSYDGSYLKFPEMNPAIELRPHQKDAIHRIITNNQSTLLHHVVGSGKTYTMAASIMKMRQLGLCKKVMVAVPNHLVQQWAGEWRKLYPNAKILVASKEDLEKDNRQKFVSKVALGDWDGIIIAQSSFAKIPISQERQVKKLKQEINLIEQTVEKQWDDSGMPRGAVKNLERIKKTKQAQLKKLMDDKNKDNVLTFENLGVDYLYIDEAHYYKNLFLFTKMNNVAGISTAASQRASDLKLKCEYLQELHGSDRGIVFGTGTPISNSMTEMYTMQSYLQPSTLKKLGIEFFDGWAADFGETVTSMELAPSGKGYQARTRFAKFTNLPELQTLYRSFSDVITSDMVQLDVPEAEKHVISLKPSDTVIELAEKIAERAEIIHDGGVSPDIDNMLKVTSDGKKLALDPRCFVPESEDEPGSKINEAAQRIYEIWEDTTDEKGTQIVFCDLSTPKVKSEEYTYGLRFDAYNDLKYKLIQKGIPADEIAFIHNANTDEQKQTLFDRVNSGVIRVLIGSTEKCGAGTNVQKRLMALHHLDTPYRPSDMEQREGRIIRQGNTNKKVDIYTYVMERTFDSYSYQILENKSRFIQQISIGDFTAREFEDIDETTLSYAEIKAITAANPRIKRKMEVDAEIARLRVLEGQYKKNLYALQDKIRKDFPEDIRKHELLSERVDLDLMRISSSKPTDHEAFEISVNGKVYTDRKEGGKALTDALYASKPETVVAEYCGFKISMNPISMLTSEREITLTANGQYIIGIGESSSGNLTRLDNFLEDFPKRKERLENRLKQIKDDLAIAQEQVEKPFEHREHLTELLSEQAELNAELNLDKREESVVIDDGSGSDENNYKALLPTQRNYKEEEIIDEEDKVALMQVDILPDYNVDSEKMHEYGYTWDGMLPMYKNAAIRAFGRGVQVYKLNKDDTETEIENLSDFDKNSKKRSLYGVEKPVWKKYLESEQGIAYLSARLQFAEAAKEVTSKELDCVDEQFTIDFIEANFEEKAALKKYLSDKPKLDAEAMISFVPQLLDEYTGRIWRGELEHYGWDEGTLRRSISKFIENAELKAVAQDIAKINFNAEKALNIILDGKTEQEIDDMNLPVFDDELTVVAKEPDYLPDNGNAIKQYLPGLLLLENNVTGDWYVINDTSAKNEFGKELEVGDKTDVRTILAYNGLHDGNPLREFNDESRARDYFDEKVNAIRSVKLNSTDHEEAVINSVLLEFDKYKKDLTSKSPQTVFENSYKTHLYNELSEVIQCGKEYLTDKEFDTLYEVRGHILNNLYDDYIGTENYSVETYADTATFIKDYCEMRRNEIADEKASAEYTAEQEATSNIISKFKEEENNKMAQDKYKNFTAHGDKVLSIVKDRDDRNIAIIQRKNDFVVAARYDTTDGQWGQGFYDFKTLEDAEKYREDQYGFENTEDTETRKWVSFKVSSDALIKKYPFNSRFRMPKGSTYEGCAYSIFNDRIRESTLTVDPQSDERERALSIRIPEDFKVELYEGNEKIIVFTASEFAKMVNGTTSDKYEREAKVNIRFPQEAIIKDLDNTILVATPTDSAHKGYVYYMPKSVVNEDKESDGGGLIAQVGEKFIITLRKGEEQIELTAKQFAEEIDDKADYRRETTAWDEYREQQSEEDNTWSTVVVNENAVITNKENSTVFKMPKGDYAGFVYYIPSGMVRKNENGLSLRIPEGFVIHLKDGDNVKDLAAEEFIAAIQGKTDEDYESIFRKPSEEAIKQFEKVEGQLRKNVPEEMLKKPNWVVVHTRENKDTGRLDKSIISPHTDKHAEINNPETWADFDTACKYAKEKGCACLAYALDGKDGIACINIDDSMEDNGDFSDIAQKAFIAASGSYTEKSISGKGLHIFGKTKGSDLRSYSKDNTMEYFQGSHFIAMTGDNFGSSELCSFDTPMMQNVLQSKLERRTAWKNTGMGVEGLSSMDDREMLDRAFKAKNGDTVKRLYNGEDLRGNHSNSDMSLMNYLAFWSNHDIEQMLRVFSTSGLYRADKPQSYYEHTAIKAVKGTTVYKPPKVSNNKPISNGSDNGKDGK